MDDVPVLGAFCYEDKILIDKLKAKHREDIRVLTKQRDHYRDEVSQLAEILENVLEPTNFIGVETARDYIREMLELPPYGYSPPPADGGE